MRRLVFLVEGDTELIFINNHVVPYLYSKGFENAMNAQKIITNRQLHKKGGNINYDYLKNDIQRVMAQGNVIITTFLDFFRLPTNFPGYTLDSNQIDNIEISVHTNLNSHEFLLPYIQKHEMEALMFSSMDGFNIVIDDERKLAQLESIITRYENPEDINNHPSTSPSNRLKSIFQYNKVGDRELILEAIGIYEMIKKCPRFREWLTKVENILAIP